MVKNIFLDGLVLAILFLLTMNSFSNKETGETLSAIEVAKSAEPFIVLELFTSQGCSSCPPADELLERTKNEYPESVFALSYHVDYWNYIGWEDPFSNEYFALKQRIYNVKLKNKTNYTPQLVVNGQEHFVGSNAQKMNSIVSRYLEKTPKNSIALNVTEVRDKRVFFNYRIDGKIDQNRIRVVLTLDNRVTSVKRGENRNRTLTNSNIVILEESFEVEDASGKGAIDLPAIVMPNEKLHLFLLLENETHDILGAAKTPVVSRVAQVQLGVN